MANLGMDFNANSVEPAAPQTILPAGDYVMQIVKSEMKEATTGGRFLSLELDVLEGAHKNRKVWERLNLINMNTQAVEIAQRTLSAICHAVGELQVSDSEQLHYKSMMVTVKVKPSGPDKNGTMREAQNLIGGYAAVTAGSMAAMTQHAAPTAAPKASGTTPPWRKAAV